MSREPFKSLKNKFNVVAVAAPSLESGPSVPHSNVWNVTAASTNYDTFYSQRYLTTKNMHRVYDLLSGVPFEHIMVLVNSDIYGGGGIYNQVTVATSDHPTFKQVFVHESTDAIVFSGAMVAAPRCALVRGILVVAAGRWEHPAVSRIMESNASTGFFIMGSSGDVFFFNSYKSHRR